MNKKKKKKKNKKKKKKKKKTFIKIIVNKVYILYILFFINSILIKSLKK